MLTDEWPHSPDGDTGRAGCLLATGTAELALADQVIPARSLATFQTLFDSSRQLIEQAQRAGHVDPDADPKILGQLVVTTHRGLEALTKAGIDTTTLNRIADAAIDDITLSRSHAQPGTCPPSTASSSRT